ncbi:uncharacterized protein LOC123980884 isoform X3 [Micropterus dolomieu]|uniref:uncharacterized protein LOC123980884 isoform X3 n=1 Tax=Micropterus dolomieu TaxID=147949 RepID=UPI001E8D5201|nr:uncharacterized protein LOC123980884 isoform X3 [Micropterus dolomieu]
MEPGAPDIRNMSTAEILRGIVAEKLTTAAQEIVAVVERTVAGYEEEASGLRQEIDRQRRQLEAVLQLEIKLEPADDQFPVCGPAAGGGQLPAEEAQHKNYQSMGDSGSMGLQCYTEAHMEEDEEEDQDQEHLSEPDNEEASRSLTPTLQSDRRAGRPQISESQDHVDLRICILEDSRIKVLSVHMYQKYPVHEMRCPRGLQEADFLDLLRSTFPQLAAHKPFDVFICQKNKKLQPLKVKTLTPEEICQSISFTGRSAIYIRLKSTSFENQAEELTSTDEEFHPSHRNDVAAHSPSTPDQTSLLSPRVQSDRSRSSRPQINVPQNLIDLRICILDSHIDVLSSRVYKKYPVLLLQCPGGLQEADFLDLLRSTFPQLVAQKDFDFFTTDLKKKLQPLKVKTLTPEEIFRSISSTGRSALYIRLKNTSLEYQAEELKSTDEEFHPSQRNDAAADSPSSPDQTSLLFPRVQSDRSRSSIPWISEPQNHVDLRICILDSQIDVLSTKVYRKYPVMELQCRGGLQEADFLDLLRSTFPQLAAQKDFDFFTADLKKKLRPLKVKTLTPEEIWRIVGSTGSSAIYIRPKNTSFGKQGEELMSTDEEFHPSQKNDAAADSPSTPDQTSLLLPRVQSDRKRSSKPQINEPPNHVDLRICILDSEINVLSINVYKKYPVQRVQCPGGLHEADFLDLLRSTFPKLADQKDFDFFTTDRKKKLEPLKVETLTPKEIWRTISSTGYSALYIRLKPPAQVKTREKVPQRKDAATDSPSTDQTSLNTRDQSDSSRSGRPQDSEPQKHVDLRICVLEDSQLDVLSTRVYRKYPVLELQFPGGLQELDFLDLLRSTFPQLAAQKHFDFFTTDLKKKLQPLKVEMLTPEEISRSIRHSALYIRLKAQEEVRSNKEELRHADAAKDSSSTDQTSLNTSSSRHEDHEDMETEDTDEDEDGGRSESAGLPVLSEGAGDGDDLSDDDRKQDTSEKHLRESEPEKTTRKKRVKTKRRKRMKASTDKSDAFLSCKVCRAPRTSRNMLIKHAWRHVDDPERLCGVCGEQAESVEELRSHLQSHQKTHRCNVCGKSFLSTHGLSGHVARHKGKKPYECNICHKSYAQNWVLNHHKWVHEADRPHKCDICQKSFYSKMVLKRHKVSHTGETLHRCETCGKSLSSLVSLSQHILRHSAKKAEFACEICSRRFNTNQKLKMHRRSHCKEEPHVCSKCSKGFSSSSMLAAHMRVHTGEKPYKCSVCDMAFSHKHCMKRHMTTHPVGSDLCKTEAQNLSDRINGAKSVEPVL